MLTGITEPIEFAFIFVAPMLFVVDVFLAGTAFVLAHVLKVTYWVYFFLWFNRFSCFWCITR